MSHVPFMLYVARLDRVALLSVLALNDSQFVQLAATHVRAAVLLPALAADLFSTPVGPLRAPS